MRGVCSWGRRSLRKRPLRQAARHARGLPPRPRASNDALKHQPKGTSMPLSLTRRTVLASAAGTAVLGGVTRARAAAPPLPSSPITLNIIDVAGNLQLTRPAFQDYLQANPKLVSTINYTQATGAGAARQAQGAAGRRPGGYRPGADRHRRAVGRHRPEVVDSDVSPTTRGDLPNLQQIYLPGAQKMQALAREPGGVRRCSARPARSWNTCPTR